MTATSTIPKSLVPPVATTSNANTPAPVLKAEEEAETEEPQDTEMVTDDAEDTKVTKVETEIPFGDEVEPKEADITLEESEPAVLISPVHSYQYDEIVFTDPTETFYDILIQSPPTAL